MDPNDIVQLKGDKTEIERRIANFMLRKRKEVDELNIQEFCNIPKAEMASEYSCARVDAVYVNRSGHVKVSKVCNDWGPQTMKSRVRCPVLQPLTKSNVKGESSAVEERLQNMESHLKIKPVSEDVYSRIKECEDRILLLEGTSWEYFK